MDDRFPYNCFKTVRKEQGGVALMKDNIGSKNYLSKFHRDMN